MIAIQKLPYSDSGLEGVVSKKTFSFHYDKHYIGYVNKTNELILGTDLENETLQNIILRAAGDTLYTALFNNAAQVYNHEFYFNSLTDKHDEGDISSVLNELILRDFSSLEALKKKLVETGTSLFGSGYVWLVIKEGKLSVDAYQNAYTPLTQGDVYPLLAIDVWEHSYYLDKQNLRAAYLVDVVEKGLNWRFASENLKKAIGENK